jgi:5-methylcytosine-specific restriction endonuclease McrA
MIPKPPKERHKRHKQTIACDISPKVKAAVRERDGGRCVICGEPGEPNMHFIGRAQGGLGIEENIATGCTKCHHLYDNGDKRKEYGLKIENHLKRHYPGWSKSKLIYDRHRKEV